MNDSNTKNKKAKSGNADKDMIEGAIKSNSNTTVSDIMGGGKQRGNKHKKDGKDKNKKKHVTSDMPCYNV